MNNKPKMSAMRALSLLHGLADFTCLDEVSDCLAWAHAHPEEINTGTLQRAVQALEAWEGGEHA